jgi:type VI secretion system protein ImpA
MSAIDVDSLLKPTTDDSPCGQDLEYDSVFAEMENAAQGSPEQQYGDTIIPAEPPDWVNVQKAALNVLGRSKDLRAAVCLARAVLVNEGLTGFRDALRLLHGYIDTFWTDVHPQLDPDDDNDPTLRINTLGTLCDFAATIKPLREVPLVRSRAMGQFSRHDIGVAKGEFPPATEEDELPKMTAIEAAFQDCDLNRLKDDAVAADESLDHLVAIEKAITEYVGVGESVSFEVLVKELKVIQGILWSQLSGRGCDRSSVYDSPSDPEPAADAQPETSTAPSAAEAPPSAATHIVPSTGGGQPLAVDGQITCREEAIRLLEKICRWFERYEPSSPLPLLLRRAKRLSTKSFLEIIRDISPDGVSQAEALGGDLASSGGEFDSGTDDEPAAVGRAPETPQRSEPARHDPVERVVNDDY